MHRPTSVTVFGILNLIFGGLGMCGLVFLAILMFVPIEGFDPNSGVGPLEDHPVFQAYQQVSVGLGFVSSFVLIAAGIGLLRLRPWGRTLSIVYAGYAIVSTILGTIVNFAVMMPIMMQQAEAAEGPARGGHGRRDWRLRGRVRRIDLSRLAAVLHAPAPRAGGVPAVSVRRSAERPAVRGNRQPVPEFVMHRPTSVTVFGILNIIFGALGLCGVTVAALLLMADLKDANGNSALQAMQGESFFAAYQRFSMAESFVSTIVLIVSGVSLLMMRRWARKLAILYAGYLILTTLVGAVVHIYHLVPSLQHTEVQGQRDVELMAALFGAGGGGVLGLAYPALLLYFMLRPNVRAAFETLPFDATSGVRPFTETGNPYQSS